MNKRGSRKTKDRNWSNIMSDTQSKLDHDNDVDKLTKD
jgi:hypothetical protein